MWGRREPEPRPAFLPPDDDEPPRPRYPQRTPEPALAEPLGCVECPRFEAVDHHDLIAHQDRHLRVWRDEAAVADRQHRAAVAACDAALRDVADTLRRIRDTLTAGGAS